MFQEKIAYKPTEEFSLIEIMADPINIREWNYAGLPEDILSIENAIITLTSKRWPLIIDPQMQANKWIKVNYITTKIILIQLPTTNFILIQLTY